MLADLLPPDHHLVQGHKLHHRVSQQHERAQQPLEDLPHQADPLLNPRLRQPHGQPVHDEDDGEHDVVVGDGGDRQPEHEVSPLDDAGGLVGEVANEADDTIEGGATKNDTFAKNNILIKLISR